MGQWGTSKRVTLPVFAAIAGICAGCGAGAARSSHVATPFSASSKHVIFNPQMVLEATPIAHNSTWPETFVAEGGTEETTYRETIVDRQGLFGRHEDLYWRRYRSVREGHLRR